MKEDTKAMIMALGVSIIFLIIYYLNDKNVDVVIISGLSILCGNSLAKLK